MKIALLTLATLVSYQAEAALPVAYDCSKSANTPGFIVQPHGFEVPRVTPYDDATIHFKNAQGTWDWMQLVSRQKSPLSSETTYHLMIGGQLTILEEAFTGRCEGSACDSTEKIIWAKLVTHKGQESLHSCVETK